MSDWLHHRLLPTMTLFVSSSTLLCCALPALLVTLGLGVAMAGLTSAIPQLVVLSEHKNILFAVAGALLALVGVIRYVARNAPCPIDPVQRQSCLRLRRVSAWIYGVSVAIYAVGFFFAFIADKLI